MDIAEKVAKAAKEGTFFGLGDERVSDAEKAILTDLAAVLQVAAATDPVPRAAQHLKGAWATPCPAEGRGATARKERKAW
jgi:hypothetical protein